MRAGSCCGFETIGADGSPAADVARHLMDARVKKSSPSHGAYISRLVRPWALIPYSLVKKGKDAHLHLCRFAHKKNNKKITEFLLLHQLWCITHTLPSAPSSLASVLKRTDLDWEISGGGKLTAFHQKKLHLCCEACVWTGWEIAREWKADPQ